MKSLLMGKIAELRNDFYGYTSTLCVECDDTISGNAFIDADSNDFYCYDCGTEIEEFQSQISWDSL